MVQRQMLCRLEDIPEGASKGYAFRPDALYADILLIRLADEVHAYRNRCPHRGAPMEWVADQFLDCTGSHIQCGIHGALFRIRDGYCVAGPCVRRSLEKVPITVGDGLVFALDAPAGQSG